MKTTLAALVLLAGLAHAQSTPTPPQPTVPERFTLEGPYVRVAYNHEGFVSIGYRVAQEQVGKEWILLQAAITLVKPAPEWALPRGNVSIRTPDGRTIPLATQQEIRAAASAIGPLDRRVKTVMDDIAHYPSDVTKPCTLQFFAPPGTTVAYDETLLGWDRVCMGRLFFHVPGGIQLGQHWLDVRFAGSTVQVPFRILTPDEEKQIRKTWDDIKKQHDAAFGQ